LGGNFLSLTLAGSWDDSHNFLSLTLAGCWCGSHRPVKKSIKIKLDYLTLQKIIATGLNINHLLQFTRSRRRRHSEVATEATFDITDFHQASVLSETKQKENVVRTPMDGQINA
jgi:hypothetical protein